MILSVGARAGHDAGQKNPPAAYARDRRVTSHRAWYLHNKPARLPSTNWPHAPRCLCCRVCAPLQALRHSVRNAALRPKFSVHNFQNAAATLPVPALGGGSSATHRAFLPQDPKHPTRSLLRSCDADVKLSRPGRLSFMFGAALSDRMPARPVRISSGRRGSRMSTFPPRSRDDRHRHRRK